MWGLMVYFLALGAFLGVVAQYFRKNLPVTTAEAVSMFLYATSFLLGIFSGVDFEKRSIQDIWLLGLYLIQFVVWWILLISLSKRQEGLRENKVYGRLLNYWPNRIFLVLLFAFTACKWAGVLEISDVQYTGFLRCAYVYVLVNLYNVFAEEVKNIKFISRVLASQTVKSLFSLVAIVVLGYMVRLLFFNAVPSFLYLHYIVALFVAIWIGFTFSSYEKIMRSVHDFAEPEESVSLPFRIVHFVQLVLLLIAFTGCCFIFVGSLLNSYYTPPDIYPTPKKPEVTDIDKESGGLPKKLTELLQDKDIKIGIILSGGGAKGSLQAGAMEAIWEFLGQYKRRENVEFIAGTSIGSWNASFWIFADPADDQAMAKLKNWWANIDMVNMFAPEFYLPLAKDEPRLVNTIPWQNQFVTLFGNKEIPAHMRYYFTWTNIQKGELEFGTNNHDTELSKRYEGRLVPIKSFEDIKANVFASMTLPPIIQYARGKKGEVYEDGGVVDNLPIQFALHEKCDLLFVIPLNSTFEQKDIADLAITRLVRVLDVRQGVLERRSLKMIDLYNKLQLEIREKNVKVMYSFIICPDQSLVQTTINTTEFWKKQEAREGYELMYKATKKRLQEAILSSKVEMVKVMNYSKSAEPEMKIEKIVSPFRGVIDDLFVEDEGE